MTAPILPLEANSAEELDWLDLCTVEACMLWPHDEAARDKFLFAARVQWARDRMNAGQLAKPEIEALAAAAGDAPRLHDLRKKIGRPFQHGAVTGTLLHAAVAYGEHAPDWAAIQQNVRRIPKHIGARYRIGADTINKTILPRYRCVAPLWAAWLLCGTDRHGRGAFPCRVEHLALFLGTAEAYREEAEQASTKHAPRPFLLPNQAVRPPDGLDLPKVTLIFRRR